MGFELLQGQVSEQLCSLPTNSVQCVVTSPPYWDQRDYGVNGQIGAETSPDQYVDAICKVFNEVRRVLHPRGTLWLNLGDTYSSGKRGRADSGPDGHFGGLRLEPRPRAVPRGFKKRELLMLPARCAMALQADGWYLRSDIIWHKTNVMPEGAQYVRPTRSHEHIFLLSKSEKYFYNHEAIKEPCETREGLRNVRDVWSFPTGSYKGAHFAVFPVELPTRCILAGTRLGETVLDPFVGSGTTGVAALSLLRGFIGIDLNPAYIQLAEARLSTHFRALDI